MIELILPWPPSVNKYWRRTAAGMRVSDAGRSYRKAVFDVLWQTPRRGCPIPGPLFLTIHAHPPELRRTRDIDNLLKAPLDSLQAGGVYNDDNQIERILLVRMPPLGRGELRCRIERAYCIEV